MGVSVPIPTPIALLNQVMYFHKSVYERYFTGHYNDAKKYNLLQ